MIEAYVIKYNLTTMVIGGPGYDKHFSYPSKAVYIPSEKILIKRDNYSDLILGPLHLVYKVTIGKKAEEEYHKLLKEVKPTKPEKIKVQQSLITWSRSLHDARNPPKEISDLLDLLK